MDTRNNPSQPSTAEILAEVERRRAEAHRPKSEQNRRIVVFLDRCVFWLSKHWLAILNALAFLYVGLPVLSPVLLHLGATGPGSAIQIIYKPLCHQLPHRSWFLFGQKLYYSLPELMEIVGVNPSARRWINVMAVAQGIQYGNATVGYKVALCQRDTAIYGTILLFGLAYSLLRRRSLRPLPWWAYVIFGIIPMGIDGGYQWLSYIINSFYSDFPAHDTTPLLRVITGALFGAATVWLAYPYVQEAMDDFRQTLQKRFGWE
jgi:uncharacterized membrane protein